MALLFRISAAMLTIARRVGMIVLVTIHFEARLALSVVSAFSAGPDAKLVNWQHQPASAALSHANIRSAERLLLPLKQQLMKAYVARQVEH
jgi:hypothetical protein